MCVPQTVVWGSTKTHYQRVLLLTSLHLKSITESLWVSNERRLALNIMTVAAEKICLKFDQVKLGKEKGKASRYTVPKARSIMAWQTRGMNMLSAISGRTLTAVRTRLDVNRPATLISNIDSHANLCRRLIASCQTTTAYHLTTTTTELQQLSSTVHRATDINTWYTYWRLANGTINLSTSGSMHAKVCHGVYEAVIQTNNKNNASSSSYMLQP